MEPNFVIEEVSFRWEPRRVGEPKKDRVKLYVSLKKESLIDDLVFRRSRPYNVYKKYVIPKVLEIIGTSSEVIKISNPTSFPTSLRPSVMNWYEILKDVKWSWDRNCGCSMCPCSPGFVTSKTMPLTIYVTIKAETEESKSVLQTL